MDEYELVFGEGELDKNRETLTVQSEHLHPDYDKMTKSRDLALLKLSKPVQFSDQVARACLPPCREHLRIDEQCFVSGPAMVKSIGKVETIATQVGLIPYATCQARLLSLGLMGSQYFCSDSPTNKDTCQILQGSPVMCKEKHEKTWTLRGITSWGGACKHGNMKARSSAYLNVNSDAVREWFDKTTGHYCLNRVS